jgi:hypothetical protein
VVAVSFLAWPSCYEKHKDFRCTEISHVAWGHRTNWMAEPADCRFACDKLLPSMNTASKTLVVPSALCPHSAAEENHVPGVSVSLFQPCFRVHASTDSHNNKLRNTYSSGAFFCWSLSSRGRGALGLRRQPRGKACCRP